jgi:hypothetical protein
MTHTPCGTRIARRVISHPNRSFTARVDPAVREQPGRFISVICYSDTSCDTPNCGIRTCKKYLKRNANGVSHQT